MAEAFQVEKTKLTPEQAKRQITSVFETDSKGNIAGMTLSVMLLEKGSPSLVLRLPKQTAQELWKAAQAQKQKDPMAFVKDWARTNEEAIRIQYRDAGKPASFSYTLLPFGEQKTITATPTKAAEDTSRARRVIKTADFEKPVLGYATAPKIESKGTIDTTRLAKPAAREAGAAPKETTEPPVAKNGTWGPIGIGGNGTREKPFVLKPVSNGVDEKNGLGAEMSEQSRGFLIEGVGNIQFKFFLTASQLRSSFADATTRELRSLIFRTLGQYADENGVSKSGTFTDLRLKAMAEANNIVSAAQRDISKGSAKMAKYLAQ